jgi:hypothetical protein
MNVRDVQERVQPRLGLERQEGDVGASGEPALEPRPRRSRAAQNQMNVGMGAQPLGHLGQQLQALLLAHAARVQRDDLMVGQPQLAAQDAGRRERPDGVGIDPVREQAQTALGDPQAPQPGAHPHADGRDQIEAPHLPAIDGAQHALQPRRAHHAEPAHRLHLQVLNVQTGARPAQPGREQCRRRGERGRLHRPDQIGPEAQRLPQAGHETAERKRQQVQGARQRCRRARQPDRAAQHRRGADRFAAPLPRDVAGAYPPFRIVRWRGDHAYFVAPITQPCGEIGGTSPGSREFGSKVETEDEDFHRFQPRGEP